MFSLDRAGGVRGLARRVIRDPFGSLGIFRRLIQARLGVTHREPEEKFRDEFLTLVAPKLEQLGKAFGSLRTDGVEVRGQAVAPGQMLSAHALHIFSLIRTHELQKIVETGVCNGLSSFIILEAIRSAEGGELISIDLPEFSDGTGSGDQWSGKGGAVIPAGKEVGWLVDEDLRDHWTLMLGKGAELLPQVAAAADIDLFVHDSEHSYENQLLEFRLGFRGLKPGGYLVATDIQWSGAFDVFWREVKKEARRYFLDHSCAVVIKAGGKSG